MIKEIIKNSKRVPGGFLERELVIKKELLPKVKKALKKYDYSLVGIRYEGQDTIKLWFNPGGFKI